MSVAPFPTRVLVYVWNWTSWSDGCFAACWEFVSHRVTQPFAQWRGCVWNTCLRPDKTFGESHTPWVSLPRVRNWKRHPSWSVTPGSDPSPGVSWCITPGSDTQPWCVSWCVTSGSDTQPLMCCPHWCPPNSPHMQQQQKGQHGAEWFGLQLMSSWSLLNVQVPPAYFEKLIDTK